MIRSVLFDYLEIRKNEGNTSSSYNVCFSVVCGVCSNVFRCGKKYLIELHSRRAQQGKCVFIYCPLVLFAVTTISLCHHSSVELLSTKYCDNLCVFHISAFVGFLHEYNNIVTIFMCSMSVHLLVSYINIIIL
jgi:hypothetical protein